MQSAPACSFFEVIVKTSAAIVLGLLAGICLGSRARASDCEPPFSACGDRACCSASQVCCSRSSVCCDASTPYCCDDGSCAAVPSACGDEPAAVCLAYEVSCGGVCIVAGSDCCNEAGDHCPPGETCEAGNTCTGGGREYPILGKSSRSTRDAPAEKLTPSSDPRGLKRSCATAGVIPARNLPVWVLGFLAVLVRRAARRGGRGGRNRSRSRGRGSV